MKKLDEELGEFRAAMARNDKAAIEDELGDVFFSLVNVSRFLRVNSEEAHAQDDRQVCDPFPFY